METPTEMTKHDKYYDELWHKSYDNLIKFSEIGLDELGEDHCENAIKAMANIFRYGNCHEVAQGLKCFINFVQSKNELMEMK